MRRAAVLLLVLVAAGCGGGGPKPDHATLTDVQVERNAVHFVFDLYPRLSTGRWSRKAELAECGSGLPVRVRGAARFLVHFSPAQTEGVPKRIVMPSGPVLEVAKVCDFEADVGWVIGLDRRRHADVSSKGTTVTVTFGG